MTNVDRQLSYTRSVVKDVLVTGLPSTVRVLGDWSGLYPATSTMAGPDSTPMRLNDSIDPDNRDEETLTKIEADATTPDAARRAARRLGRATARAIRAAQTILTDHTEPLPPPAMRAPAVAAWLVLAVDRMERLPAAQIPDGALTAFVANVRTMGDICAQFQPSQRIALVGGCHSHERAGLFAEIDPRYARRKLCRWCGEEQAMHGDIPPTKFVELHDRGIRITQSVRAEYAATTRRQRHQANA